MKPGGSARMGLGTGKEKSTFIYDTSEEGV